VKSFATWLSMLAIALGVLFLAGNLLGEDNSSAKTEKPVFVDLDGDGFDDNASADEPAVNTDKASTTSSASAADSTFATNGFFDFGTMMPSRSKLFLNNSTAFASAKQRVTAGFATRGGLSSGGDFGGGDLGSGVVIGGCCVGGVCH
jgi:hypothetical protein